MNAADPPESWLPIDGYEGFYEVSDLGRVRSLDRVIEPRGGRPYRRASRLLAQSPNGNGYMSVGLYRNGRGRSRPVHKLVAEAFLGPCPTGLEVRHGEGADKTDNRACNLSYGTHSENSYDRQRDGNDHKRNTRTCPLGHPLREPNLVAAPYERGLRTCLACSRARATVSDARRRGGPELDVATEAARHLTGILAGPQTNRTRRGPAPSRVIADSVLADARRREPGVPILLASERELARAHGVGRPTIRRAIALLRAEHVVHTQHGIGTFLASCVPTDPPRSNP